MGVTALERLCEVVISARNAAWSFTQGGREAGRAHFPFMFVLHTAFLVGCVAEPWLLDRGDDAIIGSGIFNGSGCISWKRNRKNDRSDRWCQLASECDTRA